MIIHRCPALHHVFSSHRGYRTLFASPELAENTVHTLESYAGRIYQQAGAEPEYDIFELPGRIHCIAKRFHAGADHVGRPRNCVHTVLLDGNDLERIPGFNPFFVFLQDVGFFLEPDFETARIAENLPRAFLCSDGDFAGILDLLDNSRKAESRVGPLLTALSSDRKLVVIRAGDTAETGRLVAFVSLLLPPAVRRRLCIVGTPDRTGLEVNGKTTVLLCRRSDPVDAFLAGKAAVLDFAAASLHNLPDRSKFTGYVLDALFRTGALDNIKKMLSLMERYPANNLESESEFENFLEGFNLIKHTVGSDGAILVAADPTSALKGARAFYRSGNSKITFDIVRQAADLALNPDTAEASSINLERNLKSLIDMIENIVPDISETTAFDVEIMPTVKRKPPTLFFERPTPGDIADWED
ncbi:MAG: hypothetical protein ACYS8W_21020 [Planctomycetota bacterium]